MLFAGSLEKVEGVEAEVNKLLFSSNEAGLWQPKNQWELRMPDAQKITASMTRVSEPAALGMRISGKLKSNFPDGFDIDIKDDSAKADDTNSKDKKDGDKSKEEKDTKKHLNALKEAKEGAMVVVFSDVDMLSDMIAYQKSFFGSAPVGNNASLVLNSIDFMGGSSDLINIRSRGKFNREFTVVKEIERKADEATAAEAEVINNKIQKFQRKLNELGASAKEGNEKLIEKTAMKERRRIEAEIRKANKALRDLQAGRRTKVEELKSFYYNLNQFLAPAVVLIIAIVLGVVRTVRAKRYAARRNQ
jgi:hypothetical protein